MKTRNIVLACAAVAAAGVSRADVSLGIGVGVGVPPAPQIVATGVERRTVTTTSVASSSEKQADSSAQAAGVSVNSRYAGDAPMAPGEAAWILSRSQVLATASVGREGLVSEQGLALASLVHETGKAEAADTLREVFSSSRTLAGKLYAIMGLYCMGEKRDYDSLGISLDMRATLPAVVNGKPFTLTVAEALRAFKKDTSRFVPDSFPQEASDVEPAETGDISPSAPAPEPSPQSSTTTTTTTTVYTDYGTLYPVYYPASRPVIIINRPPPPRPHPHPRPPRPFPPRPNPPISVPPRPNPGGVRPTPPSANRPPSHAGQRPGGSGTMQRPQRVPGASNRPMGGSVQRPQPRPAVRPSPQGQAAPAQPQRR